MTLMQCWMVSKGKDGSFPGLASEPILGLTNHSNVEVVLLAGWYNSRRTVAKLCSIEFMILGVCLMLFLLRNLCGRSLHCYRCCLLDPFQKNRFGVVKLVTRSFIVGKNEHKRIHRFGDFNVP